ncbi:MAG: hypothetical protein ACI8RZ_004851 [Myxococcota bacterium]|jgi:hypothetical protein
MLAVLVASTASAGPWVKSPGHAYVKAGYSRFSADTFVQPDGTEVEGTQYIGHTNNLYGEVGVLKGLQVVFNAPFVGSRNVVDDVSYINRWGGDLSAGLEYGRSVGSTPVSLQVLGKVPLYDNNDLNTYGTAATLFPAIGDGQVDVTALGAVGRGWSVGSVRGWVSGEAGYRYRSEQWIGDSSEPDRELVDGIPWNAQLGYSPTIKDRELGWMFASLGGINNLTTDDVTKQFIQASVGGGFNIVGSLFAEVGYSTMVWTRTSAPGGGLSVGLSFNN